ncbi:hypothetical protein [Chitinibacter sp. GC72]|uniref:hypothetical protein n=1 Tax=Chitinibacter sp. GC72 TaxID=1526917 RepID=UPI0018DFCC0B|nr:hypothetical protein [Chitinibacter sp. GC72]
MTVSEALEKIELHDSSLDSIFIFGNGAVHIGLSLDEVWNKNIEPLPNCLILASVYEISEFKIDRLNIIGSVNVNSRPNYDMAFVTHGNDEAAVVEIEIEFVAGGILKLVCADMVELVFRK